MNILTILGSLEFLMGVILFLPQIRRRAIERRFKRVFIAPIFHIVMGFVIFMFGLYVHDNPPKNPSISYFNQNDVEV